jgi:hypothetical protein
VRRSLVVALVECAESSLRSQARRFLLGLSSDELQFIAEFMGGYILESAECREARRLRLCCSEDQQLKLIVLREFLSQSGLQQLSAALQ